MITAKRVLVSAFLLTAFGISQNAHAASITVDSVGDSFTVSLSGAGDPGGLPVSAELGWLVTAYDATSVTFQLTVDNTSPTSSRLTSFGFDSDPDATGGTSTSTIYKHVFTSGGGGDFDVCVENDTNNNCFGNQGNVGLRPADPKDVFSLTLSFADTTAGIEMSKFFVRYQAIGANGASAKLYGDPVCTSCDVDEEGDPDPPGVPEPSMLLMGAAAAVGFAGRLRARRA